MVNLPVMARAECVLCGNMSHSTAAESSVAAVARFGVRMKLARGRRPAGANRIKSCGCSFRSALGRVPFAPLFDTRIAVSAR